MSDAPAPATDSAADLAAGRSALERRDWLVAWEHLSRADGAGALDGAALEDLAVAAFFAGRADDVTDIKERAFRAHLDAGDRVRAAYMGLDIAHEHWFRGSHSMAAGWMRRSERLLEGEPEGYAHGWLALVRSQAAVADGRIGDGIALGEEAASIGLRTRDADLRGWALMALGMTRIGSGAPADGLALLEEASIAAVNGELSPLATGVICCAMIAACRDLTDYKRASEWIQATDRYCQRQSVSGFPGVCRIHRAEIVALSGAWDAAEQELRQAASELAKFNATPPMADGLYAVGEIRRLQGDHAGAEVALREAHALGRTPQPALALIRLAEGKVKAAASAINAAVADQTWDRWARARLLPAQVEIALAAGDLERARAAVRELEETVAGYPSPALEAGVSEARGRVHLALEDPSAAATEFRSAVRHWRTVGSPYGVAKARSLLARALRALDDDEDADLELGAARAEFERLGAAPDVAAADRELRAAAERRTAPVHVRKTLMFTDVVGSTRLAESLGDEAWEGALAWHDRAIRSLVAKGGGEVVNSTGDGFFVAFDSASAAVACAAAIQRELAEHRRSSGFALPIRIGLHTAEANRRGDDYSGVGVHVASRVAGLAGAGEIVATAETLAEAGDVATTDVREAELKGVSTPTTVATISWG